jgi:hypothetical protein
LGIEFQQTSATKSATSVSPTALLRPQVIAASQAFAVVIEMSLEQIATSGVAIDTSGHHRRIGTN